MALLVALATTPPPLQLNLTQSGPAEAVIDVRQTPGTQDNAFGFECARPLPHPGRARWLTCTRCDR